MKHKLIYTCLLAATLGLSSCDKWLELKPQDGIVREEFWKTKEQVDAAVTGIYASMLGSGTTGLPPLPEYLFIWGEARTDMVTPGFRATSSELDIVNWNILPTNAFSNWRSLYETINYCNTVIELAPGVLKNDNTFTQAHLDRAIGEARTIRALMYFYLVRTFKEVPLKLTATISDEDIKPLAKSSADSVLNQIELDLTTAEPLLPTTYGNIDRDKGRATRYTVNAILADVYLWREKYQQCANECDKVINSGNFGLVGTTTSLFDALYYRGNSAESIFELQFSAQKTNSFHPMMLISTRRWGAAPHLMEMVFGQDATNIPPQEDKRGDGCSLRANDATIWKYIGANDAGTELRSQEQSFAHWIFYRYADILLMKAEAINQLNQPLEASRLVMNIRNRANALEVGLSMDSTSQENMEEFILAERQREFAFEGKRWYDVLRNAKRNNFLNRRYLLDMVSISIPKERQQVAFNTLRDENSLYFPIFLYEIQSNTLLVQNPFYK
ncbi:RagB/SusD family nutrient uptake outer membrane protein [Chitinophaga horti]|uniref:RagB/SusD family nutrient uptake outer membrane protein n=1 Tax=Chitinophaga horti TaxID=2920382 RepID=A0ABY6J7C0_9BACT|nr:RagB/SusD family nutrient uptake outer membrane protein [Chitinophaga horti]UYQ94044.1 RagB/SusD family nutrient uptake outer membrane protein [Chitinophaga horti]